MQDHSGTCPLSQRQLVEEYFIENRTKILDIAAFLDRLDRASEIEREEDWRMAAFRDALEVLCSDQPSRIQRIQTILSDPNTELLEQLDRKSAFGAYRGTARETQ